MRDSYVGDLVIGDIVIRERLTPGHEDVDFCAVARITSTQATLSSGERYSLATGICVGDAGRACYPKRICRASPDNIAHLTAMVGCEQAYRARHEPFSEPILA